MKKGLKIFLIVMAILIALGAAGYFFIYKNMVKQTSSNPGFSTYVVEKGDLKVSIQGTGSIASSNTKDVIMDKSGKVEGLDLKVGDRVSADQLLFKLNLDSIQDEIDDLTLRLKQQNISNSQTRDRYDSTKLYAQADGKIVGLNARVGEKAEDITSAHGQLMQIDNLDKINIQCIINYNGYDARPHIFLDQQVWVRQRGTFGQKFPAKIIDIGTSEYTVQTTRGDIPDQSYVVIYKSDDPFDYDFIGTGQAVFVLPAAVKGTGTIKSIHVTEGQIVKRGDLLVTFETKDIDKSLASAGLTSRDIADQIKKKQDDLLNNEVRAPMGGIITELSAVEGTAIQEFAKVATIVDTSSQEVMIEVDELDIPKVKIGQECEVRIDALPDDVFKGNVSKIAEIGTAVNGITTYDVTVSIINPVNIKIGMSATAEIFVDSRKDVILIPAEAITKNGNTKIVRVITDETPSPTAKTGNSPAMQQKIEIREITTGITDDVDTEVLTGLAEGEKIAITKTGSGSDRNNAVFMMGGPAGGGGGGGQGRTQTSGAAPARQP